eukprot:356334-Chlamydomonas_euryale.AAC.1
MLLAGDGRFQAVSPGWLCSPSIIGVGANIGQTVWVVLAACNATSCAQGFGPRTAQRTWPVLAAASCEMLLSGKRSSLSMRLAFRSVFGCTLTMVQGCSTLFKQVLSRRLWNRKGLIS